MKKIISVLLVAAILCSMVVLSVAAESGSATRIIVDCMDREVEIPETVESIVCVGVAYDPVSKTHSWGWAWRTMRPSPA